MLSTKVQILNKDDLVVEEVFIPEWNDSVRVRTMPAIEKDAFEESLFSGLGPDRKANLKNLRARLCVLTMVDIEGNRIFGDNDIEQLGKKSGIALDRIYDVAQRLNGLGGEQAVRELEKNSSKGQNEDSILP